MKKKCFVLQVQEIGIGSQETSQTLRRLTQHRGTIPRKMQHLPQEEQV